MALTHHLKDSESPVRQFLVECAPLLATAGTRGKAGKQAAEAFGFHEVTSLETQLPIPDDATERKAHAITAGIALDYRLRMALPGFDVESTVAAKGLKRFASGIDLVPRGKSAYAKLSEAYGLVGLSTSEKDPHPLTLARASVVLAWCESIFRAGPVAALEGTLGRRINRAKSAVDLTMSVDDALMFDVAQMTDAVEPLLEKWREAIGNGGAYHPNPTFRGSPFVGGADGDLALSGTLIDVKTVEKITSPWLRETLLQLLGYVVLDLNDAYEIREVAVLLPRQPFYAVWSLDDLLGTGATDALPDVRAAFSDLLFTMNG